MSSEDMGAQFFCRGIVQVIEPILTGMGYELVDVERDRSGLLRVFIDSPAGIALKDCELVSKQLSYVFSVETVDYSRLEVSSPGLDRPIRKKSDFVRFVGYQVSLTLRTGVGDRRRFLGFLRRDAVGNFFLELIEPESIVKLPFKKRAKGRIAKKSQATSGRLWNCSFPKEQQHASDFSDCSTALSREREEEIPCSAHHTLAFSLDDVERARLVPMLRF